MSLTYIPLPPNPLKWLGSKGWAGERLRAFYAPYRDRLFVTLFCGGLGDVLKVLPGQALLTDINPHLINFWQWVKTDPERLLTFLKGTPQEESDFYYSLRQRFNENKHDPEMSAWSAEAFYLLNRYGVNGLCRYNRKGRCNVPYGKQLKRVSLLPDFHLHAKAMRQWEFQTGHFANATVPSGAFLVLDPPYDAQGKRGFTQYFGDFTWTDQIEVAHLGAQHDGPVVLHNRATDRITRLYDDYGYTMEFVPVKRTIACNGDRTPAIEVIATRNFQA